MSDASWNPLREIREALGLSQTDIASALGIGRTSISKIECGANALTARNVDILCAKYGVRKEWLETGRGPMRETNFSDSLEGLRRRFDLSDDDLLLVESLLSLSKAERAALIHWMEIFMEKREAMASRLSPPGSQEAVAEAEAAYEKSSGIVRGTEQSASSTSGGIRDPASDVAG